MSHQIQRAAVIGSGTMGAGIAAHLANAGVPVLLLDIPADGKDRNAIAKKGLERLQKSKPAALMDKSRLGLIEIGNTEDDLAKVKQVDWVVEAIIEKLGPKQELLAKLEDLTGPDTIVSSNSSGIPMQLQLKGRSDAFKKRFLGTHFFNPPRYLHLLELIPTPDTAPEVIDSIAEFGDRVLGKGIVMAKDVPGFAANRVGLYCVARAMKVMLELELTPDVVDAITGPLIGRPKSATFRTMDLSGVDICYTVASNLAQATGEDVALPEVVKKLVDEGRLGEKSGQGFYKKVKSNGKSQILTLNLDNFEYEDRGSVRLEEVKPLLALATPEQRIEALLKSDGPAGEFTRRTLFHQIHYAASKVGEVATSAADVDNALKWGFGWEVGPLELAEHLGREKVVEAFKERGLDVPAYFKSDRPASSANGLVVVKRLHQDNRVVKTNSDASLLDLGDGVALLEFHSKANSIGQKVLEMFDTADEIVKKDFVGLVIGNQGQNFCAGADISMILRLAQEQNFEEIRRAVGIFQGMTSRLRYCPFPTVSAPFGMTLGGGCEVMLWSDEVVSGGELYTGLVEVGVGILPAGGGTTEMLIRKSEQLLPGADPFTAVQAAFELIGMGKVSTSALEARQMSFLRPFDHICMNHDRLISEAKARVLALAPGYTAPPRRQVKVLGEEAYANLSAGAYMMKEAGYITEYEYHLARTIARVLSGGTMNRSDTVDESVLLELEGEAFLSLSGEAKTQERLAHTLKTGKTLRN
ncbi:MAG: 3-hydroxyacyl-CoA dehydrogenase NAD-binding domain-containing protein [Vulcanimicrobiota bacterium]